MDGNLTFTQELETMDIAAVPAGCSIGGVGGRGQVLRIGESKREFSQQQKPDKMH